MSEMYDVIILGLGAMGSAACYHLARRGQKVLGLDRSIPPHALGSSHGQTRIIREAYFEHSLYVPLVQRAYELWADLERASGRQLFVQTGGLMIGNPHGIVVSGAKKSAEEHQLEHKILSAAEARRRFPVLRPADDMIAVWEPRAGILFPEACIEVHLALAKKHGATIHTGESVTGWGLSSTPESVANVHPSLPTRSGPPSPLAEEGRGQDEGSRLCIRDAQRSSPAGFENDAVRVRTVNGEYQANRLLLTAGSWLSSLVPELKLPLTVERQILVWFKPTRDHESFRPERCPIYIWEHERDRFFYGFPDLGEGVKVAGHHEGQMTSPDSIDREVHPDEIEAMRKLVRKFLPAANGPLRSAVVCMYTNTPDHHFLIDFHPRHPQVLLASPCSGHGFKFSSAIGEVLTDLLTEGKSRFDLSLFRYRWLST